MVRLLLDRGAGIEGVDVLGATALIRAASMGHPDVVRLLLERGASTAARNTDGHGALDRALLLPDGLSAVLLCAHGDTATLRSDRNRFLSRFVEPGGGCSDLKRKWDETPVPEREALLLDQVCRVDAYACKALREKEPR
jgi:ankyrin repeat protein